MDVDDVLPAEPDLAADVEPRETERQVLQSAGPASWG